MFALLRDEVKVLSKKQGEKAKAARNSLTLRLSAPYTLPYNSPYPHTRGRESCGDKN